MHRVASRRRCSGSVLFALSACPVGTQPRSDQLHSDSKARARVHRSTLKLLAGSAAFRDSHGSSRPPSDAGTASRLACRTENGNERLRREGAPRRLAGCGDRARRRSHCTQLPQSYDTKMGELLTEGEGEDMISDWCVACAGASQALGPEGGVGGPLFGCRPFAEAAPAAHPAPPRTEVAETFDSMGLHENLLRGIYAYGAWALPAGVVGPPAAEP